MRVICYDSCFVSIGGETQRHFGWNASHCDCQSWRVLWVMKQLVESWRLVIRLACFLYFFRLGFRWNFDFISQHIEDVRSVFVFHWPVTISSSHYSDNIQWSRVKTVSFFHGPLGPELQATCRSVHTVRRQTRWAVMLYNDRLLGLHALECYSTAEG